MCICDNYEGCPTYYYFTILTTDIEKYAYGNNILLTDGCGWNGRKIFLGKLQTFFKLYLNVVTDCYPFLLSCILVHIFSIVRFSWYGRPQKTFLDRSCLCIIKEAIICYLSINDVVVSTRKKKYWLIIEKVLRLNQ